MKMFWMALAIMTLCAGAALANGGTVTPETAPAVTPPATTAPTTTAPEATAPTTTPPVATAPTTTTPVVTTTAPPVVVVTPAAPPTTTAVVPVIPSTAVVMPVTTVPAGTVVAVCPVGTLPYPMPCAARTGMWINGEQRILILGSEEEFALSNLQARRMNWRDTFYNSSSVFAPNNPLMSYYPNTSITRHGNPNFPYYAVRENVRVAGIVEQFPAGTVAAVPTSAQDVLSAVKDRYRHLSVQQAMAMGYQPLGACFQNVGQVYVNQAMIDNRFDPMTPEAFSFDNKGKLLAVHYILLSDVQFTAFGHPMQPSPLVQGAWQLPVWLYRGNPNGMFTMLNPRVNCPGAAAMSTQQFRGFY